MEYLPCLVYDLGILKGPPFFRVDHCSQSCITAPLTEYLVSHDLCLLLKIPNGRNRVPYIFHRAENISLDIGVGQVGFPPPGGMDAGQFLQTKHIFHKGVDPVGYRFCYFLLSLGSKSREVGKRRFVRGSSPEHQFTGDMSGCSLLPCIRHHLVRDKMKGKYRRLLIREGSVGLAYIILIQCGGDCSV